MNNFLKVKKYIDSRYPDWEAADPDSEWEYEDIEIDVFDKILEYGFKNGLKIPEAYLLKHHIKDITHTHSLTMAMIYKSYDFKIPKKMKLLITYWERTFWGI